MRRITWLLPLLLLQCVALIGALPATLPGDIQHQSPQETQPDQPSGQYQRQQLYDQQVKDQEQLLKDREQLLYDQEQQLKNQQKQQSWRQQLSGQQTKDQQQLLRDQKRLEQDRQRDQDDQLQQLYQREQEILLDQQERLLRSQTQQQQQQQDLTSRGHASAAGESNEPSYDPSLSEADEPAYSPAAPASAVRDDLEPVVVTVSQSSQSGSDPILPAIDSLLIYGNGAEQETDGVVHDTSDVRAGSASIRKIVVANVVSKKALKEDNADLAVPPVIQGLAQNEEAGNAEKTTASEETAKSMEDEAAESDSLGSEDGMSPKSPVEKGRANFVNGDQELTSAQLSEANPAQVSEAEPVQVSDMKSVDVKESPEEAARTGDRSDYGPEETAVDRMETQQPVEVAAQVVLQCGAGSVCLKAEDCSDVVSSFDEVRSWRVITDQRIVQVVT